MSSTKVAVSHSSIASGEEAGNYLGKEIVKRLDGEYPDVLIVFASPVFPYDALIESLYSSCSPKILVGCSSAGEFSGCYNGISSVSVMAIRSDDMIFHAALGRNVKASRKHAVEELMPAFTISGHDSYPYRSALVLSDVLAGFADDLIHEITVNTGGTFQLFGGGAADDAKFSKTHVFHGLESASDAVVALGILSKKPLGIGVQHGWTNSSKLMRVTEADGLRIISINATTAADVYEQHAKDKGEIFNREDPLPFFLHNVIGIDTGDGFKLRVPLSLNDDGSITCASEVPVGATVCIMSTSTSSAIDAARHAAKNALAVLGDSELAGSLVFDCAATRLRLGAEFGQELDSIAEILGSENFAGCNTYGQIARAEGQFNGFHNCTAIVCAIPK
ncbi:MAG: FIST N-terminal domain-containing protein [Pseudomonadota bacterium]